MTPASPPDLNPQKEFNGLKSRFSFGMKKVFQLPQEYRVIAIERLQLQDTKTLTVADLQSLIDLRFYSAPPSEVVEPAKVEEAPAEVEVVKPRGLGVVNPHQPDLSPLPPRNGTYPFYHELPIRSPKQQAVLFPHQHGAVKSAFDQFVHLNYYGVLLRAAVGTGKTFMYGRLLRCLYDLDFFTNRTFSPFEVLIVTKAPIVEQTKRVLESRFGLDCLRNVIVTNYEQLRATLGSKMITCETKIKHGEPVVAWTWKPNIHPCMIVWDECQSLKNEDSLQSKIGLAFSRIKSPHTYQIFCSATPFTTVLEAKYFVLGTKARR